MQMFHVTVTLTVTVSGTGNVSVSYQQPIQSQLHFTDTLFVIRSFSSLCHSFCHYYLNSKNSCNCFCNSHCICFDSATATITAHSQETVAESSAHRNSHCNRNSKSSCNCFCYSHCICFESATATVTVTFPETFAESVTALSKLLIQYRYRKCAVTDTGSGRVM